MFLILVSVECKPVSLKKATYNPVTNGGPCLTFLLSFQVGGVLAGHEEFFFNGRWRYHV